MDLVFYYALAVFALGVLVGFGGPRLRHYWNRNDFRERARKKCLERYGVDWNDINAPQ